MKSIEVRRIHAPASQRRSLLKAGIAAALLPLLPLFPARAAASKEAAPATLDRHFDAALYDVRYPRARAYGRALRGRSEVLHGMKGDPTAVWTELLDPLWRDRPALIAGMTSGLTLFCLEQLAHVHGMRVLERSSVKADQTLVAWVIGPARQQAI